MVEILVTQIKLLLCLERAIIGSSFKLSFFLLVASHSFGQDTTCHINASWTGLKTQLQRRSDIAVNLTVVLSRSKAENKQLNNFKASAIDLSKFIDTFYLKDSVTVSLAAIKNEKLTESLARTLITTENDKKIRSDTAFIDLLMQLEGCENRIALAKQDYNNACKMCHRTDLQFRVGQTNRAAEVKF